MDSNNIIDINQSDFEKKVIEQSEQKLIIVDFWAPWCGPCRMLAPVIDKVAGRLEGKAKVAKVNTDEANASAVKFGVNSIPTIMIFKDGELQDTLMGAAQREDDLVSKVESYL